eukprot:153024_1
MFNRLHGTLSFNIITLSIQTIIVFAQTLRRQASPNCKTNQKKNQNLVHATVSRRETYSHSNSVLQSDALSTKAESMVYIADSNRMDSILYYSIASKAKNMFITNLIP